MIDAWPILVWGVLAGAFFIVAFVYVGKKTGTSFVRLWWQFRTDSIKTERKFGEEVRAFPVLSTFYQFFKWGTPVVIVVWVIFVVTKSI